MPIKVFKLLWRIKVKIQDTLSNSLKPMLGNLLEVF